MENSMSLGACERLTKCGDPKQETREADMPEREELELVMDYAFKILDSTMALTEGDLTRKDCARISAALGIVQNQFNLFATAPDARAPQINQVADAAQTAENAQTEQSG
jgi:hypothetical protein